MLGFAKYVLNNLQSIHDEWMSLKKNLESNIGLWAIKKKQEKKTLYKIKHFNDLYYRKFFIKEDKKNYGKEFLSHSIYLHKHYMKEKQNKSFSSSYAEGSFFSPDSSFLIYCLFHWF